MDKKSRFVIGGNTETSPSGQLGWWERKVFHRRDDDICITSLPANFSRRPDLLSYYAYGTTKFMWLVLQYNNILNPTTEFVEGVEIFLPSPQRVLFEL